MMAVAQSAMIEALNEQLREAFETRDFSALADMFTDDAVILPPRRNIIIGKSKIQSFWTRSNRIRELKFETDSITTLSGDVIREIGTLRMQVSPGGGARGGQGGSGAKSEPAARSALREILGKYVFVWRKINDQWKLETSIWNRNRAGTASRRRGNRRNRE
jgi:ketosteroid isomerase-like protein